MWLIDSALLRTEVAVELNKNDKVGPVPSSSATF